MLALTNSAPSPSPSHTFSADCVHTLPCRPCSIILSPRARHILPPSRPTLPSSSPLLTLRTLSLPSPYPHRSPLHCSPALATRSLVTSLPSLTPFPLPAALYPLPSHDPLPPPSPPISSACNSVVPIVSFPLPVLATLPHPSCHSVPLPSPLSLPVCSRSLLCLYLRRSHPPSSPGSHPFFPPVPSPFSSLSPPSSPTYPDPAQIAFPTPTSTTDDLVASMASLCSDSAHINGLPPTSDSNVAYPSLARHMSTHQRTQGYIPGAWGSTLPPAFEVFASPRGGNENRAGVGRTPDIPFGG
ncbi:hypothetical protein B0H14DRAFT_3454313 [Mycena olivaceomarginata]|nr:hypothetical protein B0H14DRAFT_3454313 [Mycena olivaceomarginata]